MKKILLLAAITVVMATAITSSAQASDPFVGWDCSSMNTNGGYCTRVVASGDIAWNFAGTLFNDSFLWTRFQEDNPDKVKVFYRDGKPILQWRESTTIRIRRVDLKTIADGKALAPPTPVSVGVEIVAAETWWSSPLAPLYLLLGLFGPPVVALLVLLMIAAANRRKRQSEGRPADLGPGFRSRDLRSMLNMPPRPREVVNRYSSHLMPGGFDVISQVNVQNGTFPTQYSDGRSRMALANGDPLLFGVKLDEQGEITEVVPAWAMCFNPLERLTVESAQQLIQSNPTFTNPTVLHTRRGVQAPGWEAVETFWRSTVQATAQPASSVASAGEAATAGSADRPPASGTATVHLTGQGLRLLGKILLPGGMVLDTNGSAVSMIEPGKIQNEDITIAVNTLEEASAFADDAGGKVDVASA